MSLHLDSVSDFYSNDLSKYNNFNTTYNFDIDDGTKLAKLPDDKIYPMPNPANYTMNRQIIGYAKFVDNPEYNKFIQKVDSEMCNNKVVHICPISFEEIVTPGITCYGNVYDAAAIKDWVRNHDIDPLCGRYLFTKHIVTTEIDMDKLEEHQKKIRDNLRLAYNHPIDLMYPEIKMKELQAVQQHIAKLNNVDKQIWNEYNLLKMEYFRTPGLSKSGFPDHTYIDRYDSISRPIGTGYGVEFIDLSGDIMAKFEFKLETYKGLSFNGTNLSNNVFYECKFQRCTFIGANLSGAVFHYCDFSGEETIFAGAITDSETIFSDCMIEDIGSWKKQIYLDDVKRCLKHRLLEGIYDVKVFENVR